MTTRPRWALPILALALLSGHCAGRDCTMVGCGGGFLLQLTTQGGTWPTGAYELTVTADGQSRSCVLDLAEPLPSKGSTQMACTDLSASLVNTSTCPESGPCSAVEGQHLLQVFVPGYPEQVRVELRRDGTALLDRQEPPAYEDAEINGPGCGTCRQGTLALAVGGGG